MTDNDTIAIIVLLLGLIPLAMYVRLLVNTGETVRYLKRIEKLLEERQQP